MKSKAGVFPLPSASTSPPAVTDAMKERKIEKQFSLWVNWDSRVISFSPDEGFEELLFQTHEEKLQFAIDRGNEGFGIQ